MSKVQSTDHSIRHGKLNKKADIIYREQYGKQFAYSIVHPNTQPPSKAQKDHRKLFGQVNSIVNHIMADPAQEAEWTKRMEEYNRSIEPYKAPFPKRYLTTRQYVFFVVNQQLSNLSSAKRPKSNTNPALPKGVKPQIKAFSDLSASELYEILKARFNVFYLEQNIKYPDLDNIDYLATHISLCRNGQVIAYARLFPEAQPGVLRIGRMLTVERRQGLGRALMAFIIDEAKRQQAQTLRLHAQIQAAPFYERLGFVSVGTPFAEADIQHIQMDLPLSAKH